MIDQTTQKPIYFATEGNSGLYIMLPVAQLDAVCKLLDAHAVPYWVDDESVSLDGEPAVSVINLGQDVDAARTRAILDSVP